ncbi:MAG: copper chaperone PCu(A)C [Candidatus Sericytochromatia bacterium]|nr:copper chaperone PCu(A)C [Candidatus Sericytochromatia bacterium]
MKPLRLALLGLAVALSGVLPTLARAAAPPPVVVLQTGFVPEAPPGVRVMAGFLTLKNPGRQAVWLTGATSPDFKRVEMHATRQAKGVADMIEVPRLEIPAGGRAVFAQGGNHFMMFDPRHPVTQGQTVSLILRFADGRTQTVKLPVRDGRQIYHQHH